VREPLESARTPCEPLYDAVALGMWAYTRSAFRVVELRAERYRPQSGLMLVSTHRAELDVPLICPSLYRLGRYLQDRRAPRIHFAARDDMFDRGFFAGFPAGLPVRARRLLYPLCAGPFLPCVRVYPVPYPSAAVLRLGRALSELPPGTPLEPLLPLTLAAGFRARAREVGLPEPGTVAEALRGEYADLLWRFCTGEELSDAAFAAVARRRAEEGATALRYLVQTVRAGKILLLFPEGRPSPDGEIGPLRKGLGTLVRLGRPALLQPLAVAYDPLTRGRTRAYVAFGEPFAPPPEGVDEAVLAALRRTTPLTVGQVVAQALRAAVIGGSECVTTAGLDLALAGAVAESVAEERPVEQDLTEAAQRRGRLTDCLRWACREGLAAAAGPGELILAPELILADARLARAAREYASARESGDRRSRSP